MSQDQRTPIPRPNRGAPIDRVRLKRLRIEAGLNGNQLAEKAGISTQHVNGIEHGRVGASAAMIGKLARALEVPIPELLLADEDDEQRDEQEAAPASEASR
jgi:transcriptional regulator with XRE-family HTH domain